MRTYARYFDASDFNIEEIHPSTIENIITHENFVLKADDGERHGKFVLNKTTYYTKAKKRNFKEKISKKHVNYTPYRIGSKLNDIFHRSNSKITLFEFEKGSDSEVKSMYHDIESLLFDSFSNARDITEYTDKLGNKMKNNFLFREDFIEISHQEGLKVYVKVIEVFDCNGKLFDTRKHASITSTDVKMVDNFRPFEWMTEELEELPAIYS